MRNRKNSKTVSKEKKECFGSKKYKRKRTARYRKTYKKGENREKRQVEGGKEKKR